MSLSAANGFGTLTVLLWHGCTGNPVPPPCGIGAEHWMLYMRTLCNMPERFSSACLNYVRIAHGIFCSGASSGQPPFSFLIVFYYYHHRALA
jgi:hypothetical protein